MTALAADIEVAKANIRAIDALKKPVERVTGPRHDYGDGDECPNPPAGTRHGRMYVMKRSNGPAESQWCAHSDHESMKGKDGAPDRPRTRSRWPLGDNAFAAAVAEWKEQHNG